MARAVDRNPDGPAGDWFVDTRCIDCDASRQVAPDLLDRVDGLTVFRRQPETPEEIAAAWRAVLVCPTQSVGNLAQRRPPPGVFPYDEGDGVFRCGFNARSSFGAHSYLVPRADGNLLVDSPRFLGSLAERVDELGGIAHVLLSHRDDVADADRWADRYGARVWIHEADAAAAPFATDVVHGSDAVTVAPGVVLVPIPGHTRGSVAVHVDDRWLFTGDSLHWNVRRQQLDVFPDQTWHSWDELAASMDVLAALNVEWVFTGHGMWHQVGTEAYARQMVALGPSMRDLGRAGWRRRAAAPSS